MPPRRMVHNEAADGARSEASHSHADVQACNAGAGAVFGGGGAAAAASILVLLNYRSVRRRRLQCVLKRRLCRSIRCHLALTQCRA